MNKQLLRSIGTLAIVGVLGVGVTYAQLTSNTVTISGNTINTPDAKIKICDNSTSSGDGWDITEPGFTISNLAPGGLAVLTEGKNIAVGNDDSTLATAGLNDGDPNSCASYDAPAENSGVSMQLVPVVVQNGCDGNLANELQLQFQLGTNTASSFKTITDWGSNTEMLAGVLDPGDFDSLTVNVQMDSDAVDSDTSCTFNIELTGHQVTP